MQENTEKEDTIEESDGIFYSFQKLLSYNAFLNFVCGGRGIGKSYGMKDFVAKRFINHGDEFVYVRRYATEIGDATMAGKKPIFWNQISLNNEYYKDYKMDNTTEVFTIDKKVCGYAIPLSTANIKKSATFENVKTIIFDEFTLDNTGYYSYLNNEVFQFLELLETICRMRNDVRVIFIGNYLSHSNPYFDYFNLSLPYGSEYKTFKDGLILVNYVTDNEKFKQAKRKSLLGKLIEGSEYGDYNISNKALLDNEVFLKKKNRYCKFSCNIKTNNVIYGMWVNDKEDYMLISKDYDKNFKLTVTIKAKDHTEDTVLIDKPQPPLSIIIERYRMARLFFEDIQTKNNVLSVLDTYI